MLSSQGKSRSQFTVLGYNKGKAGRCESAGQNRHEIEGEAN